MRADHPASGGWVGGIDALDEQVLVRCVVVMPQAMRSLWPRMKKGMPGTAPARLTRRRQAPGTMFGMMKRRCGVVGQDRLARGAALPVDAHSFDAPVPIMS
jgi:hypothetical protein